MNYKLYFIFFFILSCAPVTKNDQIIFYKSYTNSGFTLVFNDDLYSKKIITKKIDERSLVIFQRNLKKGSNVKITNNLNGKSIIATVGDKALYPSFYNSVVSKRIAKDIEINNDEPYIQITEINNNSTFVANKTKTYDEEKKVAEKAPVQEIGISDLSKDTNISNIKTTKSTFRYVIKIADFYFFESAKMLTNRIKSELNIKNININELSDTKFRVFTGPYNSLDDLKNNFEKIMKLEFENIEIIKL